MHKPSRITKDNPRVRLAQQANITLAIRAAILTLSAKFAEPDLFEGVANLSSGGDVRMILPTKNQNKVGNIVQQQVPQLSHRRKNHCTSVAQDHSAECKAGPVVRTPVGVTEGCHFITQR